MMTIGVLRTGGPNPNALFKELPDVGRFIKDSVTTSDRSRVYFAREGGVAVLDAVTLEQHDVDPSTPETDVIRLSAVLEDELQYAGQIFALALDPDGRYLYAAGYDHLFATSEQILEAPPAPFEVPERQPDEALTVHGAGVHGPMIPPRVCPTARPGPTRAS